MIRVHKWECQRIGGVLTCLVAGLLTAGAIGCAPAGRPGCAPAAGTGPAVVVEPAPQAIRLRGDLLWGQSRWQFEIFMDGPNYFRRVWNGSGKDFVCIENQLILPYFQGSGNGHSRGWGYCDFRDMYAPARRLWPRAGLVGAAGQARLSRQISRGGL